MKKLLIHVIDSMKMGGAESLLVGCVEGLSNYNHIIITLNGGNDYCNRLTNIKIINVDFSSKTKFLFCIFKLRSIFNKYEPYAIHTHLFWSTILSRVASGNRFKLFTTYHSMLYDSENVTQYSYKMQLIDRLTYKNCYYTIYVSNEIRRLITKKIGINGNHRTLYNYVDDKFFDIERNNHKHKRPIRIVAVGNLRPEKNYKFIINIVSKFETSVSLDIYGVGPLRGDLEEAISSKSIKNVSLKGKCDDIEKELVNYDLFLMGSTHEGFGIALAEAMAVGMPVITADIKVFREVTNNQAIYFGLNNGEFYKILQKVINHEFNLSLIGSNMRKVSGRYKKSCYIKKINDIYNTPIRL